MPRGKKKKSDDGAPGAPEWMVTFSDCMTLLLTFFVLLLSFSSFDDQSVQLLRGVSAEALPSLETRLRESEESVLSSHEIYTPEELDQGSEKPTLEAGKKSRAIAETRGDYYSRKVFLAPSSDIFWGKGQAVSLEGKQILAAAAAFLKTRPGRIVISENNPDASFNLQGLSRAWEVLKILEENGMNRDRMSISAANTTPRVPSEGRNLQLVILDKELY